MAGGGLKQARRGWPKLAGKGDMKLASRDGLTFVGRTIKSWHTIFQQK